MAVVIIPDNMTSQQLVGLLGGLLGALVGMLGAALGLRGAIMTDSKSSRQATYFPSQKSPWMIRDWFANLLFFGSFLTLLFSLIYAQISSPNFPFKPLWYTASIFALSTLFITSLTISYRIIEKATKRFNDQKLNPLTTYRGIPKNTQNSEKLPLTKKEKLLYAILCIKPNPGKDLNPDNLANISFY